MYKYVASAIDSVFSDYLPSCPLALLYVCYYTCLYIILLSIMTVQVVIIYTCMVYINFTTCTLIHTI